MTCQTRALGAAIFFGAIFAASAVRAEESPADRSFRLAQELLEKGEYPEACDLFEKSLKQEEAIGTLINLAFCHEKMGKAGRAWTEFKRAQAAVTQAETERLKFVNQHLKALGPKVGHAKLDLSGHTLNEVKVDGEVSWLDNGRVTADVAGTHVVTVVVDGGKRTGTKDRIIFHSGDENPEIKPTLDEVATSVRPAVSDGNADPKKTGDGGSEPNTKRTVGYVLAGAGAVSLGIGAYFGFKTLSLKADGDRLCGGDPKNCKGDIAPVKAAENDQNTAAITCDVFVGAGVLAAAAGIYFILTTSDSPPTKTAGLRVSPVVGARGVGIAGAW